MVEGRRRTGAIGAGCLALLLQTALHPALAEVVRSERCLRDGVGRVVELREGADGGLPCEVVYRKPEEDGSARVLWLARNDRAFCAARYEAFLVKLERRLRWECEATADMDGTRSVTADADATAVPARAPRFSPERPAAAPSAAAGANDPVAPAPSPAAALPAEAAFATERSGNAPRSGSASSALGAAAPRPDAYAAPASDTAAAEDPMRTLRALVPSGPYAAVAPAGADAPSGDCPDAGNFIWNTRDPNRPVFEMGGEAAFAPLLAGATIGPGVRLVADAGDADSVQVRIESLSPLAGASGRLIEVELAGANTAETDAASTLCRYALGGRTRQRLLGDR